MNAVLSPPPPEAELRVARQAILDGRNAVAGYALTAAGAGASQARHDAELLMQALELSGHQALAGRRQLFVRCHWDSVLAGCLDVVDPERVVIDLALPAPAPAVIVDGAARLAALRERGFRFAVAHDAIASVWRPWLPHARFLKLDLGRLPATALAVVAKAAQALPLQVLACGVDTHAQHEQARALGVHLVQGNWFARPVPVASPALRPNQAVIVQLISLLRREADVAEIEALLKRDAALSFALLRLVNGGFALATEVSSFRAAVMLMGQQRIARWATVLLATSCTGTPALAQAAVVRGRLLELLAAELLPPEHGDPAFVTGVFSLLEPLTGQPIAKLLQGMALPNGVQEALLHRRGTYAPLLALAEACESADDRAFSELTEGLLLSGHQVNMAHLQALAWGEELLAA